MNAPQRAFRRVVSAAIIAVLIATCTVYIGRHTASAAGTTAGTNIVNTSSAAYSDSNNATYGAVSNTVTVTVQNAPSISFSTNSAKVIAPGQTVTDTFTITNTGNAAGDFQLTADPVPTGTGTTTSHTYSTIALNGGTAYSGSTWTSLNSALLANQIPVSGTIQISVTYTVSAAATVSQTVITDLTGGITYAATTGTPSAPAATSTAISAPAETDTVYQDASLNLQLFTAQTTGPITYTLNVINSSPQWAAKDSAAVQQLLGSTHSGVFISMKVPTFGGTPLALTTAVNATWGSTTNGSSAGSFAYYYTTVAGGASGWTAQSGLDSGATYVGVLVYGGSCTNGGASSTTGYEICPTSVASSPGSVASPALTMTFTIAQPTGTGSGNANAISALGNSVIGNNAATELAVGPDLSVTDIAGNSGQLATGVQGIDNVTPESTVTGASQIMYNNAVAGYSVGNGPLGNPIATGEFDGGSSNDTTHDFTVVSFADDTTPGTTNTYTTTNNTTASWTPTLTGVGSTANTVKVKIENTIQNTGNTDDSYNIKAYAPTGWTVWLQNDSANTGGVTTGTSGATGAGFGSVTSTNGTTSTASSVAIASGVSYNYWTVYTAPIGTQYLTESVGYTIATSTNSGSTSDQTNHLMYAGFVAVTTTAVTSNTGAQAGCSGTISSAYVCPGGTITYTIDYRNIIPSTDLSSVTAVSFARVTTAAGTLKITDDGVSGATSNWGTYTNGLQSAPVDSFAPSTTYDYLNGATEGALSDNGATLIVGATKFIATIGGGSFQLKPRSVDSTKAQGTLTFTVTVK